MSFKRRNHTVANELSQELCKNMVLPVDTNQNTMFQFGNTPLEYTGDVEDMSYISLQDLVYQVKQGKMLVNENLNEFDRQVKNHDYLQNWKLNSEPKNPE